MAKNDIEFNVNPAASFMSIEEDKPKAAKKLTKTGRISKKLAKPDFIKNTHYTIEEAQQKMGLCFNTLKKLFESGEISRVRHGRPYYVPIKDVENYMKKHFKG